jgi:phosphoglycerate kinase
MRSIKNINVKGKRVLVRVDFNVPIKNGKVEDDFRIKKTLPTINLLKKKGAKIILISHFTDGRARSLRPIAKYLKIKFAPDLNPGEIKNGEIVLLENIRNYSGEEKNDPKFAKKLAAMGDIYVNDAFSVSHRPHASIIGITKYLPSYMGLLFEEEFKNLSAAFKPKHPFLLILGGIKFETKLGVVNKFLRVADKIFIGGALVVRALQMPVARNPKIIFPIGDPAALDANAETLEILKKIIKKSKFILWNGPLGNYEKGFTKGTLELAKIIAKSGAVSIIGGGDTIAAIKKIGLNHFSFVSTAGGAMLEFLAHGTLPGVEALVYN